MSFQSGAPFWSTSSPSRICLQGLTRAHAGHRGHWPYLLLGTVRSPWNSHLLEEFHSEDLFIFNSLDPLDPTHYRMWLNKKCCHYPSLSPFFILFSLFNWLQRSRNGMFTPLKWCILCCLSGRRGRLSPAALAEQKKSDHCSCWWTRSKTYPNMGQQSFLWSQKRDLKMKIWVTSQKKIWWCTCTNIFGNVTGKSWDTPWMGLGQYRRDDHAWKRRWRFTGHSLSGLFENWVAPVCINYHIATPKRIEKIVCHNF